MKVDSFQSGMSGTIVRSYQGHDTFVPALLPPHIDWSTELVLLLSNADAALSELSGLGRQMINPHLLINPYLRREAVLSSRIEGTRVSLSELLLDEIDAGEESPAFEADRIEVRNYVAAMELGIEILRNRPVIGLNLVKELHARLMRDVPGERGENALPGRFRTTQNWIGAPGSSPATANFVPPAPEVLPECLNSWEWFVNQEDILPPLVQCALMHQQFETIHPFNDGNGRVGRLLVTLFLLQRQRLSQPLLYLSDYIEPRKNDYYDLLQRVRTHGDRAAWIRFFLEGVLQTARRAAVQSARLSDLREAYRDTVADKARALALVDNLFSNPFITTAWAARLLGVSPPTARSAILHLESHEILKRISGYDYRHIYVCDPILSIIQGRDPSAPPQQ